MFELMHSNVIHITFLNFIIGNVVGNKSTNFVIWSYPFDLNDTIIPFFSSFGVWISVKRVWLFHIFFFLMYNFGSVTFDIISYDLRNTSKIIFL